MKRPKKILASLLALVLVLAPLGCSDSDYRKAARAADQIASGLDAVQDLSAKLYTAYRLIDKEEARALQVGVIDATLVNDEFIAKLRALKRIDGANKQKLGAWFGEVLTSLEKLEDGGAFHVKNENARLQLRAAFRIVRAAIATFQVLSSKYDIPITRPSERLALQLAPGWQFLPPAPSTNVIAPPLFAPAFDFELRCSRRVMFETSDDFKRCPQLAALTLVGLAPASHGGAR